MQIYGAPEGTRGCNRLLNFLNIFFLYYYYFLFFFYVPSGASNLYFSHSNLFIFSPFPGHQMFIFWPVENCTTWNLRYLMLRDAGWALRHWRSCSVILFKLFFFRFWQIPAQVMYISKTFIGFALCVSRTKGYSFKSGASFVELAVNREN